MSVTDLLHDGISCPACSEGSPLHPKAVFAVIQSVYGSSYHDHRVVHGVYMSWLASGVLHSLHERVKEAVTSSDSISVRRMVKTEIDLLLNPNAVDEEISPMVESESDGWGDLSSSDYEVEVDEDAAEQLQAQEYWNQGNDSSGDPFGEFDQGW